MYCIPTLFIVLHSTIKHCITVQHITTYRTSQKCTIEYYTKLGLADIPNIDLDLSATSTPNYTFNRPTLHDTTQHNTTQHNTTTPRCMTPHCTTPYSTTTPITTPHCTTQHYTTPHSTKPHCTISYCMKPHYRTINSTTPHCTTPCKITSMHYTTHHDIPMQFTTHHDTTLP